MTARQIIEAEDPKKALRANPEQGLGYREREIDYDKDYGWNFLFGSPIRMSFNVVGRDMGEAVSLANAHFDRLMGQDGVYLKDELDTGFSLDENLKGFRLTEKQCLMWWPLGNEEPDADPIMNPDYTG